MFSLCIVMIDTVQFPLGGSMKKYYFEMLLLLVVGLLSDQTWISHYPLTGVCPVSYDTMSSDRSFRGEKS